MNIDALIEKIKPTVNLGEIPCIRASIFTLREAQQGIEGRAYKLV